MLTSRKEQCEESCLPQNGSALLHRGYVKMNFEYFLRLCVRKHGKDYASAVVMLSDMKRHDRLPKEMRAAIEAELMEVARSAGNFIDVNGTPDDDSDDSSMAASAEISCMPCGEEFGFKTAANCREYCGTDHARNDEAQSAGQDKILTQPEI